MDFFIECFQVIQFIINSIKEREPWCGTRSLSQLHRDYLSYSNTDPGNQMYRNLNSANKETEESDWYGTIHRKK